ncbi:MAG TPA: CmpA/NrtA family ABC transporter substrate-binding protein [Acetobacteraceae bacterium]|jgi:NitT/TauT family transport system ATP-binding protein/nitrate/nitrite transport system substrate-binding protein
MNHTTRAPVRFGLLRLADSAPAVVAVQRSLFRELGLRVELSVEPSWANIVDKLSYGLLDAASMLPPLALAASLGLRGPAGRLLVPMGLSAGGNTITIGRAAAADVLAGPAPIDALEAGRRFGAWLRAQPAPPRFAVVHAFSTHNLLLRYWLAASGVDPDRDISAVVIPPEEVEQALADGRIAGFCAGAPWGELAAERGSGRVLLGTSSIWGSHPEKCLAIASPWAAANPEAVRALLRGLLQAQRICEQADAASDVAHALSAMPLGLPFAACRACLPGGTAPERIRFHAGAVWFPWRSHAGWFLGQMRRWGWLEAATDLVQAAHRVYRPDLLAAAAADEGLAWPDADSKREGAHAAAWSQPGRPSALEMMADRFCDGALFDQNGQPESKI